MLRNFDADTLDLLFLVASRLILMPMLGVIAIKIGMSYERAVHSRKRGRRVRWCFGWAKKQDLLQPINESVDDSEAELVLPTEAVTKHNRRSAFKRNSLMLTAFTLSTAWQVRPPRLPDMCGCVICRAVPR